MTRDMFCAQYTVQRRATGCEKWDGLAQHFGEENLLAMWVADMEFKAPDAVRKALAAQVQHGAFGYALLPQGYLQTVQNWQQKRHGYAPSGDWLRFAHGVVSALHMVINAFTSPGEGVLIFTPVYGPFYSAAQDTGRKLVKCPLVNEGGIYTINLPLTEKLIQQSNVRVMVVCSPHNPVGRVWSEEELSALMALCQRHNVLLVADEIHQDLILGPRRQVSALGIQGGRHHSHTIALTSASKTFNLAGLIHAHIFIPHKAHRKIFDTYAASLGHTATNTMGCVATQAAYAEGEEWLEGLLATIRHNLATMQEAFVKALPQAVLSPLEGTYLLWADLRPYFGGNGNALKAYIQQKCGLAVNWGPWFGEGCDGFVRINLGTAPQHVAQAARRLCQNPL